jgi:hypothetical protein
MSEARATGTFNDEALILRQLKDRKELAAADLKAAEDAYKEQESVVLDLMTEQGISSTKIPGVAMLVRTETKMAVAEDWGAIYQFIEDNNMPQLLQRRLMQSSIDELANMGTAVPGVGSFTKVGLSVRKA